MWLPLMLKKFCVLIAVFVLSTISVFAQYGISDPLFYQSFNSGVPAFGTPFPGYSNYLYSSNLPPFGYYVRINNGNVAPNVWWPATDHSGTDGDNGYMWVAKTRNGSSNEVLFEATVNGFCEGTTYEIGAYVLNLSKNAGGIAPEIIVRLVDDSTPATKGNIIAAKKFGPIAQLSESPTTANWDHPLLPFIAPANMINAKLQIVMVTAGGPFTNDIALDDISLYATGKKIDVAFFNVTGASRTACASGPRPFRVTVTPPEDGNDIKWQKKFNNGAWVDIDDSDKPGFAITSETTPGIWNYRVASAPPEKLIHFSCSVVSNELEIVVEPSVIANAGPNKFYLRGGKPAILEGSTNTSKFSWTVEPGGDINSLSSTTVLNPLATPNQTTTYRLNAIPDKNTCGDEPPPTYATVIVADEIKMPNTFTPNGDGINDKWVIGGINTYPNPSVQVYNRQGQLMFKSIGVGATPWDGTFKGKNVPAGSYYYIVDLNINGMKLSGSVTVLR